MKKKWMFKLGAPILALALVSACGTANNNDDVPGDDNAPGTETPDNNDSENNTPENEAPENDVPENDNLNKNNGEPTAPEDGENDQIQDDDQNVE